MACVAKILGETHPAPPGLGREAAFLGGSESKRGNGHVIQL
jgi:hypothetical protein